MKKSRIVSLILTFAMVVTMGLGCMTGAVYATEGQADTAAEGSADTVGPVLQDYSIAVANATPKTEKDSEIIITLMFNETLQIDRWTPSAFNISINNRTLHEMGFQVESVTIDENNDHNLVIDLKGDNEDWVYVVSGKLDISLKSNYYEDIMDAAGNQVSDWTDIHTYVQTGLEFTQDESKTVTGDENTPASVTFDLTGDAKMRGASPVQILVGDQAVNGDARGAVYIHTHMFKQQTNVNYASRLASSFSSDHYVMTADGASVTLSTKTNGPDEALTSNTKIRMFAFAPASGEGTYNDYVVQPVLFNEELAAAEERLASMTEESVTDFANKKKALEDAIAEAKKVDPSSVTNAVAWNKIRNTLQDGVNTAADNAITSTAATRNNGSLTLSLNGGSEWTDTVNSVSIQAKKMSNDEEDGEVVVLNPDQYSFGANGATLVIKSTALDVLDGITPREQDYDIVIRSSKFNEVSQTVTVTYMGANSFQLRYIDKEGNVVASAIYTKEEMIAMSEAEDLYYNTACSMTGVRTFKAKGVYIENLLKELKTEDGSPVTFNPDQVTVKLRTNDSLEGDENDSTTEDGYYFRSQTTYNNLMQDRYSFPGLYDSSNPLGDVVKSQRGVTDAVRAALGSDESKVSVRPMIAYEYVEKVYRTDDSSLENDEYDADLAADKAFRFLFGTAMTEEDGQTVAASETTTWMASYQVFGLDIVDESVTLTFDTDPSDAEVVLKDNTGKEMTANEDGTYTVASSSTYPYTYTVSKDGYVTFENTIRVTEDETVNVTLTREEQDDDDDNTGGSVIIPGSYNIVIPSDITGGTIRSDKQKAKAGETVTLTVKAAEGYTGGAEVRDVHDNLLTLKDLGEGQYSFIMPTGNATVTPTFTNGQEPQPEPEPEDPDANCPSKAFVDLDTSQWYHEAVDFVLNNGTMKGTGGNTFEPETQVSRAMIVQMLYNMEGTPAVTGTGSFTDVSADDWFASAVQWASSQNIVSGMGDGTFQPNSPVTREQTAVILQKYAAMKGITGNTESLDRFADGASVSDWAQDAVKWCIGSSVLNGMGDGTLQPQGVTTRAQMAQVFLNLSSVK